jgi:cytochrome c peroxidase
MSVNGTQSCASCHQQELAFTDGRATAQGATGQKHPRSSMSLVNVVYASVLTWGNRDLRSLEQQALIPILASQPVELGLSGREDLFLKHLSSHPLYRKLFTNAFPGVKDPFTLDHVVNALAAFERTIISARSPYDRFYYGSDSSAISESAQRGQALFFGEQVAGCFRCHSGFNFSDATVQEAGNPADEFHNTALYNLPANVRYPWPALYKMPGSYRYPWPNVGIFLQTGKPSDVGKFKTPSLRNVALTAPYMHDGSVATLEDVLDHYAAGGRTISNGAYVGRGHDNPDRDPRMTKFTLTPQNRQDLLAFLRSLTDEELTHDPRFSNPWQ